MINKSYEAKRVQKEQQQQLRSHVCCIKSMQAIFEFKLQLDFSNRTKWTEKCVVSLICLFPTPDCETNGEKNKQTSINRVHLLQSFKNRDTKLMIYQMAFQSVRKKFGVFCYSSFVLAQAKTNHKQNRIRNTNNNNSLFRAGCFMKKKHFKTKKQQQNVTTFWLASWKEQTEEPFTISLNQHIFPSVVFFATVVSATHFYGHQSIRYRHNIFSA